MRDSYHLRRDLGFLAKDNGQLDTAIRAFERSVELRPSPRAWYEKARLHGVRDEWALAAESYEGAYALAPFPAPYIVEFVQALVQAGRREQALQILNDGLKKFPRNPSLLKARGEFAAETR